MATPTNERDSDSPPSPTTSFYAMSDDEEGEYNTIRHAKTGKGVKLLYTKSKVYVHPTPSSKDNIPGFVALIQQKTPVCTASGDARPTSSHSAHEVSTSSLLLAWVPESSLPSDAYEVYIKLDVSDSSSPPKTTYLVPAPPLTTSHGSGTNVGYAFSIPVSEIYSLLVRPPAIGWWYGSVVINTRAGDSFPALFFHDDECKSTILQRKKLARESFDPFKDGGGMFWGGDEVLRWLKRYCRVERAGADPNIYLVDPTEDDRKGFGKLELQKDRRPSSDGASASGSGAGGKRDGGMDPLTKVLKETRWNILEKLSQVTTFTRRTAQAVADNKNLPPQLRRLIQNPEVQILQEEFDSARIYLARWAMGIAEQSERERNQRIWTAKEISEWERTGVGEFEILDMETGKLSLSERRKPVTLNEWNGWFNAETGRLEVTVDEVKERIFHGGLDPDDGVRKEAWLFLLGVHEWNSTKDERKASMNSRRDEYIRLKGAWWERMVQGSTTNEEQEWWREQKNRIVYGVRAIEKDVHRTDRHIPLFAGEDIPHPDPDSPFAESGTNVHLEQMKDMLLTYNEYNKELGYVQGMSDLLAPIYAVMQDDAVAFWAFVNFMERMERNFLRDQSGMRLQLLTLDQLTQLIDPQLYLHLQTADSTNFFFFFRMLLVWYKREFQWLDVLRLWESLWTDYLSGEFALFVAVAILEKHREVIMQHLKHFDEILKYVNELSNTIDLQSTLIRAEQLFRRFQKTVETIDKKNNFPAPQGATVRQRRRGPGSPHGSQGKISQEDRSRASKAIEVAAVADRVAPGRSPARNAAASGSESAAGAPGKRPEGADPTTAGSAAEQDVEAKVISPELRRLLGREAPKMNQEEVKKHGGGVGS